MYAVGICHIELWDVEESIDIYGEMIPQFLYIHNVSPNRELNAYLAKTFVKLLFFDNTIIDIIPDHQSSIDMFVNTLRRIEEIKLGLSHYEKVLNRLVAAKAYECIEPIWYLRKLWQGA
jgi:hypothetical protein